MLMTVALNEFNQLVGIEQVERGLSCGCTCFECGEPVVAKKGEIKEHHFAHANNKESCNIKTESILHKYAKQVIEQEKSILLPALPSDKISKYQHWKFENVDLEQSIGSIRPDIVATCQDELIFIEIAVTSFIDKDKQDFIEKLKIKTVEIDLSCFLNKDIVIPNDEIKDYILNNLECKAWVYPKIDIFSNYQNYLIKNTENICDNSEFDKTHTKKRFTINHVWVDVLIFNSGMVSVRCVTFNHDIKEMLKSWSREGGGRFNMKYKSWNYYAPFSQTVLKRLSELDMTPKS